MPLYLATHEQSGNELFSHRDDAVRWVEDQARYHEQQIGKWSTYGEEQSLCQTGGETSVGTVTTMVVDKRAEHRVYEAEQRAEKREAEYGQEVERLRAELEEANERSSARLAVVHQRDMELLAVRTPKQRLQAAVDKVNAGVPAYALRVLRAVVQEMNVIEGEWRGAHRADAEDVHNVLRRIRTVLDAEPEQAGHPLPDAT